MTWALSTESVLASSETALLLSAVLLSAAALVFAENLAELFFFAFAGANIVRIIRSSGSKKEGKHPLIPVLGVVLAVAIGAGMMLLG